MMTASIDKLPEKLRRYIQPDMTTGCWTWVGRRNRNGYGRVNWEGREPVAHRVIYTILCQEIAEGMKLDHLCRNRPCVNPTHMEQVTVQVNTHRGEAVLFRRHWK